MTGLVTRNVNDNKQPKPSTDPVPGETDDREQELGPAAAALEEADVALGKRLAADRNHPVVRAAAKAGKLGDQEPLYALGALLAVLGLLLRRRRLGAAGVAMLAAVAAADAGKSLAKRLVKRTRPHVLLDNGDYHAEPGGSPEKPEQSFPSGHVAGSIGAARAVTRVFPEARPWQILAAMGIGVTRVLKGAHWPLDTVAGLMIGLAAEAASSGVILVLARSLGWQSTEHPRKPRPFRVLR